MVADLNVKRHELKFFISHFEYQILSRKLSLLLNEDRNSFDKPYLVRSLYFDTPLNKDYMDKIKGIEERRKYRIRIYDVKGNIVKFEIKNKKGNIIHKETVIVKKSDAKKFINGNYEVLLNYNNDILNKIYLAFKRDSYRPIVIIDYFRTAFFHDMNNIRITFDQKLSCNEFEADIFKNIKKKPILSNEKIILEIKYNNFIPNFILDVIQFNNFEKCAISKYCMSRSF